MASSGQLACDVALTHFLLIGGSDWENVDVMNYIGQSEQLDTLRLGMFPDEGQADQVVSNGKSQVSIYGARRNLMAQWGQPDVL